MRSLALVSLLLTALLWQDPALAGESACGHYTLAYYELGALYYRDSDGRFAGIDKDVAEELSRRSGCQFKTVLESRVRIWDQLSRQVLDLSVSGIATPEREKFADFIPYFQTRNYALLRQELSESLATPEAFLADGRRLVGVVKSFKHGAFYDAWLQRLREQQRVVELADFETAVRMFKLGRVDALLALPTSLARLLQQASLQHQIKVMDWAPQDRIVHALIVSRQRVSETDRERLRVTIQAMQADGSLENIFTRHVGERLAREMRLSDAP
ncbi:transporter substrate-binding domain-containing protein [Paucibacter sp. AS339]|uniref:substrate-binding periplasmic protein n=1 Tax=Paucibacter hankyongi TaxID=3133434 RepID=UPI00309C36BE